MKKTSGLVLVAILLLIANTSTANIIDLSGYDPNQDGKLTYYELMGLGPNNQGRIEDKLFYNFSLSSHIPANQVIVIPLDTPLDPGLRFSAGFSAPNAYGPNGTSINPLDSAIIYSVKPDEGGRPIKDVSLLTGGYVIDGTGIATYVTAGETVYLGDTTTVVAQLQATNNLTAPDPAEFEPTFGPLRILGDLYVSAGPDNIASISIIEQRFSEVPIPERFSEVPVPEPATMLLLGSGLLGIGVYARKRSKK